MHSVSQCLKKLPTIQQAQSFVLESDLEDVSGYAWMVTTSVRVYMGGQDDGGIYDLIGTIQFLAAGCFIAKVCSYIKNKSTPMDQQMVDFKNNVLLRYKSKQKEVDSYFAKAGIAGYIFTISGMDNAPARAVQAAFFLSMSYILYGIMKDSITGSNKSL